MMNKTELLEKVKKDGFDTLEDFVRANVSYLPKNNQRLFQTLFYESKDKIYEDGKSEYIV